MTEKKGLEKFKEHSRNWIFNFQDTEVSNRLLAMRMSDHDTEFLSAFPHFPSTITELADRFKMSEATLLEKMKPLLYEGFIYEVEGKSGTRFSLTDPLFFFGRLPGWRGIEDEWTRAYAPLMNEYYDTDFGADFMGYPTKGLRAIPINQTIKEPGSILPYEDLLAYVDREDYHTVSSCACRHNINMDSSRPDCKHEVSVCLHFGRLGKYAVKHGMGRKIEKAETLDILQRCAESGLVHGISNTKNGMDTICNCCSCCCIFLRPFKLAEGVKREYHQRSNYLVEIDRETCVACGLCEKRCPIDALQLVDKEGVRQPENGEKLKPKDCKEISYDSEKCIGCGVCAYKCPTGSLKMVKRETIETIPENFFDAGMRMIMERGKDMTKMF